MKAFASIIGLAAVGTVLAVLSPHPVLASKHHGGHRHFMDTYEYWADSPSIHVLRYSGRSVAVPGNYCATAETHCALTRQAWLGESCTCPVTKTRVPGVVQ